MAEDLAQRRLAAILAADVVGYSGLMEIDEAGTLTALKAHMGELVFPAIAAHHGRVVKTTGDGCLAEFGSVVDAVRCAVAVQRGIVERNVAIVTDKRLLFRIGINLGDVVVEGDDLFGDGVNVAARLEQLAQPGGVLLSGTVYDQLQGKLDVPLEFVGEQHVKNITRPVRAYRVVLDGKRIGRWPRFPRVRRRAAWAAAVLLAVVVVVLAGGAWYFWPQPPGLTARASLAVLPFENIAGDDATGQLADGLTEDIITDLSRYREMDVIAHNTTKAYRGRAVDLRQVGKDLNVRYGLEGSVQREGDQIRITAQLIEARNGTHLWSERWDRPAKDFFAVQTEIADQVANRLGGSAGIINKAEYEATRRARPENLTAYELYLAGRNESVRATPEGTKEAIRLLQRAVEADPSLARAWVELAGARMSAVQRGEDPAMPLSEARRAIEIDPGDAWAHAVLGYLLGMQGDFARSEAEFNIALRLNPGSADILALYTGFAATFGHAERAAETVDRAIRLNPSYPSWHAWNFSYIYFINGRYEDTLRILERLPTENYLFYQWVFRAASYAALGQATAAKAALSDALAHHPDLTIEGVTGTPDWSEAERKRLIETMRAAGFPSCAKPETLARLPQLVRLPECRSN